MKGDAVLSAEQRTVRAARDAFRRGDYDSALSLFSKVADEIPLDSLSRSRLGVCKFIAKDYIGAAGEFEKVWCSEREDMLVLTQLGCSQEMSGAEVSAAKTYREVIANSPNAGTAYANLGYMMMVRGNLPGALDSFRKSLEPRPVTTLPQFVLPSFDRADLPTPNGSSGAAASSACVFLGLKLQEAGRFEDAQACFSRAIQLDPQNGAAYSSSVFARKITESDSRLIESMQEMLAHRQLATGAKVRLNFALGKAMDDLRDYEAAMRYYDDANRLRLEEVSVANDREVFTRDIDNLIRIYSKESFVEADAAGSQSDLPVLIVGMMRSGTTLLEQIVSSHPEVTGGEELTFWTDQCSRQIRAASPPPNRIEAQQLADAYLRLLSKIDPDALRVTDKMPYNFMAVGIVHTVLPNARILCLRRNPIDTCLSIYRTDFRHEIPFVNRKDDLVYLYREFDRLMNHWRSVIPEDRLLEVSYEELLENREPITRRVIDFCGLEWNDSCLQPENNPRPVKTASLWQVRQGVYASSINRWQRYEPWLGVLRTLMEPVT